MYKKKFGSPPQGTQLDHLCRNRACINPDHMEPVSTAVNQRRGSQTKLSSGNVVEIRQLRQEGQTYSEIAAQFGVGVTTVRRIVIGEDWAA